VGSTTGIGGREPGSGTKTDQFVGIGFGIREFDIVATVPSTFRATQITVLEFDAH
jgi:hypothetical protein